MKKSLPTKTDEIKRRLGLLDFERGRLLAVIEIIKETQPDDNLFTKFIIKKLGDINDSVYDILENIRKDLPK